MQPLQTGAEVVADFGHVLRRRLFFHHLDDGQRRGARDRIAAEGADGQPLTHRRLGDLRRGHGVAQREAAGDALGHGHDVRFDAPVFDAEPVVAGAAKAGLHLVDDQQPAVTMDDVRDDLEVFGRRGDETADAHDRFGQKRGDLARSGGTDHVFHVLGAGNTARGIAQFQRAAVAVGRQRVLDTGYLRWADPPDCLRGQAARQRRAATVAVPQRDDFLVAGDRLGQHHRGFVSLGA